VFASPLPVLAQVESWFYKAASIAGISELKIKHDKVTIQKT